MKKQRKLDKINKKDMLQTFLKRLLISILMFGSFGAAFGLSNMLILIRACLELIVLVIIGAYPIGFGSCVYKHGFLKAWNDLNPEIYIKSIILMALFDMELENAEDE